MNGGECVARILIVDDDENFLASIRRILQGQFEIVTTRDPVQALKIVEYQGPFAAIISDYRMPFMNGIELFSRVVAVDKKVQRILLTGYPELQMAIDAVNHGKITAFLTKPTPSASLRSAVMDAVQTYKDSLVADGREPDSQAARTEEPAAGDETGKLFAPLTIKEKEVLCLVARGLSNAELSLELSISVGTVKTHLNNLFWKMDVNSRTRMIAKAIDLGLVKR